MARMPSSLSGVSNCYVFKSRLQEYAQKAGIPTPVYETTKEGPSHEPSFRSTVIVDNVRYDSLPGFFNRKAAEQSAAEIALMELAKSGHMKECIAHPVHETGLCKNLLQEYAQKMNYAIPSYICHKDDTPGKMPFSCTVEIGGIQYIGAAAKTKKEAEIKAARTALLAIQAAGGTDVQSNGNSQYTVVPCKKKGTELDAAKDEAAKALKPKKVRFKKKWPKKRFPRNKSDQKTEQAVENAAEVQVTTIMSDINKDGQDLQHSGSTLNQNNAFRLQVEDLKILAVKVNEKLQNGIDQKNELKVDGITEVQVDIVMSDVNKDCHDVKHLGGTLNQNDAPMVLVEDHEKLAEDLYSNQNEEYVPEVKVGSIMSDVNNDDQDLQHSGLTVNKIDAPNQDTGHGDLHSNQDEQVSVLQCVSGVQVGEIKVPVAVDTEMKEDLYFHQDAGHGDLHSNQDEQVSVMQCVSEAQVGEIKVPFAVDTEMKEDLYFLQDAGHGDLHSNQDEQVSVLQCESEVQVGEIKVPVAVDTEVKEDLYFHQNEEHVPEVQVGMIKLDVNNDDQNMQHLGLVFNQNDAPGFQVEDPEMLKIEVNKNLRDAVHGDICSNHNEQEASVVQSECEVQVGETKMPVADTEVSKNLYSNQNEQDISVVQGEAEVQAGEKEMVVADTTGNSQEGQTVDLNLCQNEQGNSDVRISLEDHLVSNGAKVVQCEHKE
ncbi:PREDICTED: uncharacterized protein LOC104588562 [Nelumbo nucifera]|uniref:Uncharacterized protein LOC104588562 n=2 Tax=Nelumbo nucifera TaxID=4432 RepID=A0A1U7YWI4_NELNU|nr:PREDICTED: uncharacterized protein LOC104588562 [Nelumbo nucifera]XP_010244846.1 PREDICTED: uncharacterized protein LOC104588562 [Nelumbo nucifera]DAD39088.1 TPA_asm: hypothetical protein HUJ06_013411 [Nelumbo nucifera]